MYIVDMKREYTVELFAVNNNLQLHITYQCDDCLTQMCAPSPQRIFQKGAVHHS